MNLPLHFGTTIAAGTLAGNAIHAFLSAAALHLGEADDGGRRIEAPQASAAWLALLASEAMITTVAPLLLEAEASDLGRAMGRLLALFSSRYPNYEASVPQHMVLRLARDGQTPVGPLAPAPLATRLPGPHAEPVDVDALVNTVFQGLLSVAGYHLGDRLPNGDHLAKPDPDEAALCLRLAGALLGQLVTLLSDEAAGLWGAMLSNKLDQWEGVPQVVAPVASLREVIKAELSALVD